MHEIPVNLGARTYSIHISMGAIQRVGRVISQATSAENFLLVSNPTVFPLYGHHIVNALNKEGFKVQVSLMPDGERYKNMKEALEIIDQALGWELDRSSAVIALGGGVVGDLAGFVASITHRGIDFIQIPTTLLAQVDSSVGGKVAVNHAKGKNLIGAFHQPQLVVVDPNTLKTLEDIEFRSGLGEVVKYGIIYDSKFFGFLEDNSAAIKSRDGECIENMIAQSCRIKSEIVEKDEHELGLRMILNLGHTFGHSLEMLGGYELFRHGEAVAMGTIAASFISLELGLMKKADLERIQALYTGLGLKIDFPPYKPEDVYAGMMNDKKIAHNRLRIVLPTGIGSHKILEDPPKELIYRAITRAQDLARFDNK